MTIFIAHIMFVISYVVVTVKARLIDFDVHLEEAAMDLGANGSTTFRKVTLPLLAPAILGAALLGFALSIDDFVDHVLQRRLDVHVPAVRLGRGARFGAAAGKCDCERDLSRRALADGHQHPRPEKPHERTRMSTPTTAMSAAELQQAARDHLWLHFTRMGGLRTPTCP